MAVGEQMTGAAMLLRGLPVARHGLRVIEFDATRRVRRLIDYPW
jgi:hypothetical protein